MAPRVGGRRECVADAPYVVWMNQLDPVAMNDVEVARLGELDAVVDR